MEEASLSAARLERPPEEKDRRARGEENELPLHVTAEDAVEEGDPGDEETRELQRARKPVHGRAKEAKGPRRRRPG